MNQVFEDASDFFVCLPNDRDGRLIEDAFTAIQSVYVRTWKTVRDEGGPTPGSPDIEAWMTANAVISPKSIALARGLGSITQTVFRYYVEKAISDCFAGHSPFEKDDYGETYTPWLRIGFPLPFEDVTIETTDDGLDWLRFGEIGPVQFGFTGTIPSYVHTVCFKRTEDFSGYEAIFVGHQIDPAEGEML